MTNIVKFRPIAKVSGDMGALKPSRTLSPSAPPADADRLIEAIKGELISTATLVAMTSGLLNGSASIKKSNHLSLIANFIPADPVVFRATRSMLDEFRELELLIEKCEEFYTCLKLAKQILKDQLGLLQRGERIERKKFLEATEVWQATAAVALLAIYEIERAEPNVPVAGSDERAKAIAEALMIARDGGTPFLENGVPTLPEWAERRYNRRYTINAPATLMVGQKKYHVMVVNASRKGIGIDLAPALKDGDLVSVELQNGRRFLGIVAWCHGRRVGITLRRALPPDDPLLAG